MVCTCHVFLFCEAEGRRLSQGSGSLESRRGLRERGIEVAPAAGSCPASCSLEITVFPLHLFDIIMAPLGSKSIVKHPLGVEARFAFLAGTLQRGHSGHKGLVCCEKDGSLFCRHMV
jgi:hypothetical protein